jgi:hypothetical protein
VDQRHVTRALPTNIHFLKLAENTLARGATYNGKALLAVLEKADLPPSQKVHLASLIPPDKSLTAPEDSNEH